MGYVSSSHHYVFFAESLYYGSDVAMVSANNYFNFTPLLAGCAVGTLELRCAVEPVSLVDNRATSGNDRTSSQVRRYSPQVVGLVQSPIQLPLTDKRELSDLVSSVVRRHRLV